MFCGGGLVEEDLDSKLEELMLLLPEAAHCIDQMEPFVVARCAQSYTFLCCMPHLMMHEFYLDFAKIRQLFQW